MSREDSVVLAEDGEACRRAMSSRSVLRVEADDVDADGVEATEDTGCMAKGAGGRAKARTKKGIGDVWRAGLRAAGQGSGLGGAKAAVRGADGEEEARAERRIRR